MKRRLIRGMTTMEFAVSSTIMVGVMVLSFDVMATGVQITKKAQNDSTANEQNRSTLDKFVKDVQTSEAIMEEFRFGSENLKTSKDEIVLRLPKFNAGGVKLLGQYEIVGYYVKNGPRKDLVRVSAQVNLFTAYGVKSEVIARDVHKLNFYYGRNETLSYDYSTGKFYLPNDDKDKFDVDHNHVRLSRARCSWNGATYNTRAALWGAPGFSISGKKFTLSGATNGDTVDVMYYISPKKLKNNGIDCKANMAELHLKLKSAETGRAMSEGESELMTSASTRNGDNE